jgi:hypothetical protein
VEVVISELFKQWQIEESEQPLNELTKIFALYLTDYSWIQLSIGGTRVDAAAEIARRDSPIACRCGWRTLGARCENGRAKKTAPPSLQ